VKDVHFVTDAKVAAALSNSRQRSLVLKLAGSDQSLQALSDSSGVSLSLLSYHIGRLVKLGLVKIVQLKSRPGRKVKYYRATAKAFFVPVHLSSGNRNEELTEALQTSLQRSRKIEDSDGVLYSFDEQAGPRMQLMRGKGASSASEQWVSLNLSRTDAVALGAELRSLLHKYQERQHKGCRQYLVHCALAPLDASSRSRY
jgi:DNA-binding transcriptional ArsR family regulator